MKESQTEAQRLADLLEYQVNYGSYDWERVEPLLLEAAAELRRLNGLAQT